MLNMSSSPVFHGIYGTNCSIEIEGRAAFGAFLSNIVVSGQNHAEIVFWSPLLRTHFILYRRPAKSHISSRDPIGSDHITVIVPAMKHPCTLQ